MEIYNDNERVYIDDSKISATWLFIGKDEKSEAITLFENLLKDWDFSFGIYEETNSLINPKIDFFQKSFGKKKLDLFIKNRTQNYIVEIDNIKYYIDFTKLDTLELWEYFFKFIFDDFFYSHLLLKVTKKNYNENLFNITESCNYSSNIFLDNYFQFNNDNIISNIIFGYSHTGKKVFIFLSNLKVNKYFHSNISKEKFQMNLANVVLFRPFDAHINIYSKQQK